MTARRTSGVSRGDVERLLGGRHHDPHSVLGAHVEGPFLNPSFRGAHLRACLIDPTPENVDVIASARPRLVTLAPELPGGLEAISRLHHAGIVVSAGHTWLARGESSNPTTETSSGTPNPML